MEPPQVPEAQLVQPSALYKTSFLAAMAEFAAQGKEPDPHSWPADIPFETFLAQRQETNAISTQDHSIALPHDRVANVNYWLVSGEKWLGLFDLRLVLNEFLLQYGGNIGYMIRPSEQGRGYGRQILRLGLDVVRKHGLNKVLITCHETNVASRKVIEGCGGVFENEVVKEGEGVLKRYWIRLSDE